MVGVAESGAPSTVHQTPPLSVAPRRRRCARAQRGRPATASTTTASTAATTCGTRVGSPSWREGHAAARLPTAAPATRRCRCPPRRAAPRSDTPPRRAPAPAAARAGRRPPGQARHDAAQRELATGYKPRTARRRHKPGRLPQPRRAVDGGKQRRHGAHAAARHQVHPHAGLVERAHGAGVIRAVDAAAGEDQRGAPVGGVVG